MPPWACNSSYRLFLSFNSSDVLIHTKKFAEDQERCTTACSTRSLDDVNSFQNLTLVIGNSFYWCNVFVVIPLLSLLIPNHICNLAQLLLFWACCSLSLESKSVSCRVEQRWVRMGRQESATRLCTTRKLRISQLMFVALIIWEWSLTSCLLFLVSLSILNLALCWLVLLAMPSFNITVSHTHSFHSGRRFVSQIQGLQCHALNLHRFTHFISFSFSFSDRRSPGEGGN